MAEPQSNIGPGVCVAWWSFDLPTIWSMIEGEGSSAPWDHAIAWRTTCEALDAHTTNLKLLRDKLVERWPPERSQASAAFLDCLNGLIDSVPRASSASATNANALSDLTDILANAKARVQPLYEQWQANVNSGEPDPKVQASLKDQAALIMYQADEAVYQQGERFVVPPEYEAVPTVIEPYTPFLPPTGSGSVSGGRASSTVPPVHVSPLPDASTAPAPGAGAPILSGGGVAPPGPEVLPGLPASQPRVMETPAGTGLVPGLVIGLGMNNAFDSYGAGRARLTVPGMKGSAGGLRNSSGGFTESGALGAANGESARRGAAALPGGSEGAGSPGGMGGMLGGAGAGGQRRRLDGGEAYTEWPVAGGGPAVLMPPREPDDHDPGPGVLGIDR
jgi:hypothetical protein